MTPEQTELLKDLFSYHPPRNPEEQANHDRVNNASLEFALAISEVVKHPGELITLLRKIQEVKMLANASVAYDRTGISYQDLFKK